MQAFTTAVETADGWISGRPLIILILAAGVYLSVRVGFVQLRHPGLMLQYTVKNEEGGAGEVTSFGALCTALSATIGTGNIVGVATAIASGGPGALLWMLTAAFFGMATKYAEGLLAVKYREETAPGRYLGGPFYYIEKGLGRRYRWLAKLFSLFGVLAGVLGIGTVTQISGVTEAAQGLFDPEKKSVAFSIGSMHYTRATVTAGLVVTVCAALVIIGGIRRIAKVCEIVVPFMACAYVLPALVILLCNFTKIPAAVALICRSAFDAGAVGGAIAGLTLKRVMRMGVGRGIFSNEAGLGSAPIAAAAAKTREPVRQGLVAMTGTFIDTGVICTVTGLTIVVTGAWDPNVTGMKLEGVAITTYAWQHGLPIDPTVSSAVLMICLAFFAFTTILGWNYYAERCLEYLLCGSRTALRVFRPLYILAVLIGPYLSVSAVWGIAGVFNSMMAFPNLVALLLLGGVVSRETEDYFSRLKTGKISNAKKFRRGS